LWTSLIWETIILTAFIGYALATGSVVFAKEAQERYGEGTAEVGSSTDRDDAQHLEPTHHSGHAKCSRLHSRPPSLLGLHL
jgi:hypothetical protein